jgi:hypothetical protein
LSRTSESFGRLYISGIESHKLKILLRSLYIARGDVLKMGDICQADMKKIRQSF